MCGILRIELLPSPLVIFSINLPLLNISESTRTQRPLTMARQATEEIASHPKIDSYTLQNYYTKKLPKKSLHTLK
jgi:hypothetical protein